MSVLGITRVWVTYTDRAGKERRYKYWKARIMIDGHHKALGHYKTKREARQAYKVAQAAKSQQAMGA